MFERKRKRFMESPVEELVEAGKEAKEVIERASEEEMNDLLTFLGLSRRTEKLLLAAGFETIAGLRQALAEDESKVLGIKGLGLKALDEIYVALKEFNG